MDVTKKRGPGRPPSKPITPAMDVLGVTCVPSKVEYRLEFSYGDPSIFKALFAYFKNVKAREIHLRCNERGLTFFARDHSKKSRIVASIAGEHVNMHYSCGEFWLGISRNQVEKMFASIDKTFYKITIVQTFDDTTTLTFIFKDASIEKDCWYKIQLPTYGPDEDLYNAENLLTSEAIEQFPVEFTLSAKLFKKAINDAINYSDTITFEKIGESPLTLTYNKSSIIYHEIYRNGAKISLRSSVGDNMIFRSTIALANIKSLANSMVTNDVRILCKEDDDILFRSAIDTRTLIVSTLTKMT